MKCLVTGGAGFIGSHIVEALIKRGDSVRVLDNFSTGRHDTIAHFGNRIDFHRGDLRKEKDLQRAVKGIDVIFHQAALRSVTRSMDNPIATNQVNIDSTLSLLLCAKKAGVRRVIYASSSSVYGDNHKYPQNELLMPSPLSPYAVSKLSGELYCRIFSKTFGMETVSLRYFNVFGPRQHRESMYATVIPIFMDSALKGEALEIQSDGKQSRDFTYIDNVVQANLLAAEKPKVSGDYFNIAHGKTYSLLDIIAVLEKLSGRKLKRRYAPARAGDVRKTWADIRKAKRLLGYKPRIGLEEGLARTWHWFVQAQHSEERGQRI